MLQAHSFSVAKLVAQREWEHKGQLRTPDDLRERMNKASPALCLPTGKA